LVGTIAVLLVSSTAHAATWYVHPDSALNSIQAGIDLCSTGDTVLVGAGTYFENINFNGMAITVTSEYGPDTTIIDGSSPAHPDTGSVVLFISGEDTNSVLEGFTITNGTGTLYPGWGHYGGGILCADNSSPTITGNTITGNTVTFHGGGIDCWTNSSPTVTDNIITDNESFFVGGGIGCYVYASPTITGNTITGNTAVHGGGIASKLSSPTVTDNIITDNAADSLGGGLAFRQSSPTISHNIIEANTALCGGGISCDSSSFGTIDSCTISGNNRDGVYCAHASSPVIHCCNISSNTGYGVRNIDPSVTVNADSNWWGDSTGPYHPSANPGGLGDTVSDYVDFDPWLSWPVGVEEQPIVEPVEEQQSLTASICRGPLQLPEGKKCKVFDITGRVVEPNKIQPGIYFIELDGVVTQKVVKVR
jgi:parallel beta-helix repeat protein